MAQVALISLIVAPLAEAIWPAHRFAWTHLMVIPGFQWVVVSVGTWVVFAHAGRKAGLMKRWPSLIVCSALWLVATALRMFAEFQPAARQGLLDAASLTWLLASITWLIVLLPRVRENT